MVILAAIFLGFLGMLCLILGMCKVSAREDRIAQALYLNVLSAAVSPRSFKCTATSSVPDAGPLWSGAVIYNDIKELP